MKEESMALRKMIVGTDIVLQVLREDITDLAIVVDR